MDERPTPDRTRRREIRAVPLTLADGLAWGLALPATRLRPTVVWGVDSLGRPTEAIRLVAEYGYPAEIRRAIDRLRSECEAGDASGQREAILALGVALLRRAHDVGAAFAASLFETGPGAFPRLAEAIVEVVTADDDHDP